MDIARAPAITALAAALLAWSQADVDYMRGMAAAREQRWSEARQAFEAGRRRAPLDKRFPLELAGVAFKLRDLRGAESNLRRALRLDSADAYANDFAATIYLLNGNLPAALKYWNRVGRPRVENVAVTAPGDHALLDRALAFAPASVLKLEEYRATEARLDLLGAFRSRRFDLAPREDESFDLELRALERGGWLPMLRGLAYSTVHPEWFNIRGSGAAFVSMLRWDHDKRRASAEFSAPIARDPSRRYRVYLDARRENWDVTALGAFRMDRVEGGAAFEQVVGARLNWSAGAGLSHRRFRGGDLQGGVELKQRAGVRYLALDIPERRLCVRAGASSQLGRLFARGFGSFWKTEGSIEGSWLPRARGEDYANRFAFRTGATLGAVPFDELYLVGIERDNELWLRGHAGTRSGQKGSAPTGRNYALVNWESDKVLYSAGALRVAFGPFLDTGRVWGAGLAPRAWLWDAGVQARIGVLGRVAVVLSYGRDLRTGRGVFYAYSR